MLHGQGKSFYSHESLVQMSDDDAKNIYIFFLILINSYFRRLKAIHG